MKIAVIDLGTNTFNLLIKDTVTDQEFYNNKIAVKLGQGGLNENIIAAPAFERGIAALADHKKTILRFGTGETYALATSAIRNAQNGHEFVAQAQKELGITINIIEGHQEADLIYEGVKNALALGSKNSLIMDIGGGSTEFIVANETGLQWKKSYDIGASRLLEKFRPSDPVTANEIEEIERYLHDHLSGLLAVCGEYKPATLIGSSGSFDTLAAMVSAAFPEAGQHTMETSYIFEMYRYKIISQKMLSLDIEQRLRTPGMIPMRADMIVTACIQLDFILKKLQIPNLCSSVFALKEGVFYMLKENKHLWQKSLL